MRKSDTHAGAISSDLDGTNALWTALAVGVVGVAIALTYALAVAIETRWVFVI